jgi:iron complex transport system substrate-binding protein
MRAAIISFAIAFAGCRVESPPPRLEVTEELFDESRDYYDFHVRFDHLQQIQVEYGKHYKVVRFTSNNLGETETWLLVQRGTPVPPGYPDAKVVSIPLVSYAMGSFRYGGVIDKLGELDTLVSYSNWKHASVPALVAKLDSGLLSKNKTPELLAGMGIGVIFDYYSNSALLRSYNGYRQLGIVSIPLAEHLEPTPLARSEWIKVFALFFNKEREASEYFDGLAKRYQELRTLAAGVATRPSVAVNVPMGDAWPVYGAENQLSRFIEDAGGAYIWSDQRSRNSIYRVGIELAMDRSLDADILIIGADSAGQPGLDEWMERHPQLKFLRALREGRAFATGRRDDPGRNPYWDYALIQPDVELADHIKMIHPQLLPEHRLTLYRPVERNSP